MDPAREETNLMILKIHARIILVYSKGDLLAYLYVA